MKVLGWTRWSKDEERKLWLLYPGASLPKITRTLKRHTLHAIRTRAHILGIKRPGHCDDRWSNREESIVKRLYSKGNWRSIGRALPSRTLRAIKQRATTLGIKRTARRISIGNQWGHYGIWNPSEDARLKALYSKYSVGDISQKLGRSIEAISSRATRLRLKRPRRLLSAILSKACLGLNKGRKRPDLGAWVRAHPKYGRQNSFYGKKHSEKTCKILSECGKRNKTFAKLSKDPEFQKRRLSALLKRPTKGEGILDSIIRKACPGEYRYVGNGKFIIDGLNPDWVNVNGKKKIIELFGRSYHDPEKAIRSVPFRQTEKGRKRVFRKYGYQTLVIWDNELYSLIRYMKHHPRLLRRIRKFTCT